LTAANHAFVNQDSFAGAVYQKLRRALELMLAGFCGFHAVSLAPSLFMRFPNPKMTPAASDEDATLRSEIVWGRAHEETLADTQRFNRSLWRWIVLALLVDS